jgi:hypothetical protein
MIGGDVTAGARAMLRRTRRSGGPAMLPCPRFHPTAFAGVALLAFVATADLAHAQAKLEASYTISVARIPVGSASTTLTLGPGSYAISASGRASAVLRILASGDGTLAARGTIKDGKASPLSFTSKTSQDDDTLEVAMTFEDGVVKELKASAPQPSADRLELSDVHRRGVLDPLSALLIPATAAGDGLTQDACRRTLPVFDGRRRFDLKLTFKRMDKVQADKGYAGPVVVCAMTFVPIAGHRSSSTIMKYLSDGRDMEIALAPVAGTRMLAPFRVTVFNMLGNLVLQADRFETQALAARALP